MSDLDRLERLAAQAARLVRLSCNLANSLPVRDPLLLRVVALNRRAQERHQRRYLRWRDAVVARGSAA